MSDAVIRHAFVSAKPDGPDTSRIRASNWNANLLFSGGVNGELAVKDSGSATGAAWTASAILASLTVKSGSNFFLHHSAGGGGGGSYENTAFGYKAGNALTGTGYANVLIGTNAGAALNGTASDASSNVMVGYGAGELTTIGKFNTFVGAASGGLNTTQADNSFFGYHAGVNAKGTSNIFIGSLAGRGHTSTATGVSNVAVGNDCLKDYTTAQLTAALGLSALEGLTSGNNNTALGALALRAVNTGANNLGVGYAAGDNVTTGSNNIAIGYNVDAPSPTGSNQLTIGNLIFGTGLDGTGTTISTGKIGIGTNAPTSRLHVVGLVDYANNAAAVSAGLTTGAFYRTAGAVQVVT